MRERRAWCVGMVVLAGCNNGAPATNVLSLSATLPGPGGEVVIDYEDDESRGEWWPCDARLTARACVGDAHVAVFFSLPVVDRLAELGSTICVDGDVASGAYEIFKDRYDNLADARIPEDVSAFVVVGSDADGDGVIETLAPETHGAARVVEGRVEIFALTGFDAPLSLRLTGTTENGEPVAVTFLGPMTVPAAIPGPEGPASCP
jgi:hypothetical protein